MAGEARRELLCSSGADFLTRRVWVSRRSAAREAGVLVESALAGASVLWTWRDAEHLGALPDGFLVREEQSEAVERCSC